MEQSNNTPGDDRRPATPISRRTILRGGAVLTAGWISGGWGWLNLCSEALAKQANAADSLASWALGTLGSKASDYAGDLLWGQVMTLFGLPGSGDANSAKLDQISSQLESINQTLNRIEKTLGDLQGQLTKVSNQITTHVSEENFKTHVNALNRLWGKPTDIDVPSLGALLAAAREGEQPDIAGFMREIDRQVQPHITGIYEALTTTVGTNQSLLQQWTNLLISKLYLPNGHPDFANLQKGYELLESYFLQGLSAQLKGVALRAARFGYKSGLDPVAATARARTAFINNYREQAERFLWCTEHLVFALTSIQSDADMNNGPLRIFRRADVLSKGMDALLAGQGGNLPALFGGSYGRILCRASNNVQPGSKPNFVRINGTEYPGTMPTHASGIPWAEFRADPDGGYPELLEPAQSLIKIVRVRGPYLPYPQWSKLLSNEAPRTNPTDCCVDVDTFEPADMNHRTPRTVEAAAYVDRTRLANGTLLPPGTYSIDTAGVGMKGNASLGGGALPSVKQSVSLRIRTPGGWTGETAMKHSIRQPLFITSANSNERLTMALRGTLIDYVTEATTAMPQVNNNLSLSIEGDDGSSLPIYKSNGSPVDRWDRAVNFSATALIESRAVLNAQPGVKYDLVTSYVSTMRAPQGSPGSYVQIGELLRLDLQLGIVRPLVGTF